MSISLPTSKDEYKEWCLRRLGKPVVKINVDDDQIEDCVQYALKTYYDYHFDGSDKTYYKYVINDTNRPNQISQIDVIDGGTGYQNTDTVVITSDPGDNGANAEATIITNANGTITSVTVDSSGTGYLNDPASVTVTSNTGSNAVLAGFVGGFVPIPDNIIGIVNIFDVGYHLGTNNLFNIRYQIALNDLYTLTSVSLTPYFMAMQHIQFMEYLLVGRQPIRYQRHKNKLYLDINWSKFVTGQVLVVEAYKVIDPNVYTDAWNDRWLLQYGTQLMKQQWGTNMKKYGGVTLPNGVQLTGQETYDEATAEIYRLESEMINSYSLPVIDMIG